MNVYTSDMDENNDLVPAFYGSEIKKSKACGYCCKHHLYLTVSTLKKRECLSKQCNALCKMGSHDFWRQHEQKKEWRKAKKQMQCVSYH